MLWQNFLLLNPDKDRQSTSLLSGFTQIKTGESSENKVDEKEILSDKDITGQTPLSSTVKRFKMTDTALEPLEDLPADFMRGEVDVKTQMDLAASAMDSSLRGLQSQSDESSPRGELGASFRDTPGGLEEVAAKTDEYIATHGLRKKKRHRRNLKKF